MKLYIISRPSIDFGSLNQFLSNEQVTWKRSDDASATEELVEISGRICYMSYGEKQSPRTNAEYIRNLIESGHESVLEHAAWSFIVTGISRALSHQLVRHRIGFSYSQLSQQYHDESESISITPTGLQEFPEAFDEWNKLTGQIKESYDTIYSHLLNGREIADIPKEELRQLRSISRSVLPNALETKLVISSNARALRHFIRIRGTIEGDLEMREYSCLLLSKLKTESPELFFDLSIEDNANDGLPIISASA